jgi:hypothetical protein
MSKQSEQDQARRLYPAEMTDREMTDAVAKAMKLAKIDPAFIYAFEKTGRLVGEQNRKRLSKADLKEWNAVVDEYRSSHPEEQ